MLGASAICAGLAVSAVDRYAGDIESQVGPLRTRRRGRTGHSSRERSSPRPSHRRRWPNGRCRSGSRHRARSARAAEAVGLEAASAMAAGDYVGVSQLRSPAGRSLGARGSQARWSGDARLVEVAVAGARTMSQVLRAGAKVDVLITTDRGRAAPRTFLALQRMPVVGFESGAAGVAR